MTGNKPQYTVSAETLDGPNGIKPLGWSFWLLGLLLGMSLIGVAGRASAHHMPAWHVGEVYSVDALMCPEQGQIEALMSVRAVGGHAAYRQAYAAQDACSKAGWYVEVLGNVAVFPKDRFIEHFIFDIHIIAVRDESGRISYIASTMPASASYAPGAGV